MTGGASSKTGIKEIASRAGVSIGTVDRVLHNRGEVKKETHDRVMRIVNEMGYTPNLMAKALSSKKMATFAVVIPDSSDNNPYWLKPVEGIELAQRELAAYNARFSTLNYNATNSESFCKALTMTIESEPDGVLVCPAFKEPAIEFCRQLDEKNIPYVFIDINITGTNNIGYFGQDAFQSGVIAAKLMMQNIGNEREILIVKQSANKIFSEHIELRISGFCSALKGSGIKLKTIEIDLGKTNEPQATMNQYANGKPLHIFVPNSRAFVLADYIERIGLKNCDIIGYDLIGENVAHLRKGNISFLLNQRPDEQSYKAIMQLFNYVVGRKEANLCNNFSPIDIIIKENVDYYQKSWIKNNL